MFFFCSSRQQQKKVGDDVSTSPAGLRRQNSYTLCCARSTIAYCFVMLRLRFPSSAPRVSRAGVHEEVSNPSSQAQVKAFSTFRVSRINYQLRNQNGVFKGATMLRIISREALDFFFFLFSFIICRSN